MGFFGEMISEVVGDAVGGGNDSPSDPPYVQPPWVARWDSEAGRWIFLNEETGERSWEKPVLEEAGEILDPINLHMTISARKTNTTTPS